MALIFPSGLPYDTTRHDESGLFIGVDDLSVPRPTDTIVFLRTDKQFYRSVTPYLAIYEQVSNLGGPTPHLGEFTERFRMDVEVPASGERWFFLPEIQWPTSVELKGLTWIPSRPDSVQSFALNLEVNGVLALSLPIPSGTPKVLQTGLGVTLSAGSGLGVSLTRTTGSSESAFNFSTLSLLLTEV